MHEKAAALQVIVVAAVVVVVIIVVVVVVVNSSSSSKIQKACSFEVLFSVFIEEGRNLEATILHQ